MITKTASRPTRPLGTVVEVPIDKCHPHPANRQICDEDCAELAESLQAEGRLLQPILVRSVDSNVWQDIPLGHYQIVFGERRWRAARLVGWDTIAAEIREDLDDASALRMMAVENAQRADLNPIEQARAMKRLCDSPADGGGGLTRQQAAAIFGLQTGPAATNKIRLLELPDVWQQRVVSGEIPETVARQLLPYVGAANLMGVIDKGYCTAAKHERERYATRDGMESMLQWMVRENLRRLDNQKVWHSSIRQHSGCLFKPTAEELAKLHVVTINLDGKPVEVAQNAKLFDELQKAAHDVKAAKAQARLAKASKNGKSSAAEDKKAAEKRDEQLGRRIHEWRQQWIRWHLAQVLQTSDWQIEKWLIWAAAERTSYTFDLALPLRRMLAARGIKCDYDLWVPMSKQQGSSWDEFAKQFLAEVLVGPLDGPPPNLPDDVVDGLAADYGFDIAKAWSMDHVDGPGRQRLARFFELHQSSQIEQLAAELNVPLSAAKTKAGMVKLIVSTMSSKRLPLPKVLAGTKRGRKR